MGKESLHQNSRLFNNSANSNKDSKEKTMKIDTFLRPRKNGSSQDEKNSKVDKNQHSGNIETTHFKTQNSQNNSKNKNLGFYKIKNSSNSSAIINTNSIFTFKLLDKWNTNITSDSKENIDFNVPMAVQQNRNVKNNIKNFVQKSKALKFNEMKKESSQNFHQNQYQNQSEEMLMIENNLTTQTCQEREKQLNVEIDLAKWLPTTQSIISTRGDPLSNAILKDKPEPLQNVQIPREYLVEIYNSLLKEELENRVKVNYIRDQLDINEQMRAILIDWLIDVHLKFSLKDETLFLTTSLIDRYLSRAVITRSRLQLLGVACLMIACKQEEIYTPHIKDFVYITDSAYAKEEILGMELEILKLLEFNVVIASPLSFFMIISQLFNFTPKQYTFGRYLMEVFLIDYRMTKYLPSLIACTCSYILMKFFHYPNYQEIYNNIYNANSSASVLKDCARDICYLIDNIDDSKLMAAKRKFSSKELYQVSLINFA